MNKKYSLEDVGAIVSTDGLGYAITGYIPPEKIEDENLRLLWQQARETLEKIEKIINPYTF